MEVQELVGWNLRRLRVERKISQDDLALIAEVERAYVGYLERGKRNPTVAILARLANALEVHISELFVQPLDIEAKPRPLKPGRKKTSG
ncbi:helix-turn-helix domain-containing protein [Shinella zoogloeoides]|uniref:Helix-turn-helix domain-containing protein n=1 Tax=Shinella zoogloeoides TaxID=352475 RepID=A0A6N8TLJ9_SHIZO|nr:helix-turn-helix transcriptional regulator [Shinella zoogloeoides]MXO03136.1 helix-turn-helix domain-containing protein [Shinella zoogloeoides]UEX83772.1 helix-turn-helix domain-containing protein [Shinella zoogloeoides]